MASDPSPTATRSPVLDVLRGIAILGTLATNVWIFTDPEGLVGYVNGTTAAVTPPGWRHLESLLQQLAQGKFLGLLTLMFGIGLELQRRSALRRGHAWPGRYPWRAGLLFVDGVVHYLLVVEFDVLMGYAVTGLVVAAVLATSPRSQRRWMVAAATVHLLLLSAVTALLAAAPTATPTALRPNPYADGTWWDLVGFRVDQLLAFRLEPIFITALSIASFLAGAHLLRAGVLDETGGRLRRRLMVIGLGALVVDLTVGLFGGPAGLVFARYGTAPLVAAGLLAGVTAFLRRRPVAGIVRPRLAAVGRAALSCYVLQNVLASALCYGWGLGLAARIPADLRVPGTLGIYLVVSSAVVAFATLWLRRFDRGPVELAWRRCFDVIDQAIPARSEPTIPPVRSPRVSR